MRRLTQRSTLAGCVLLGSVLAVAASAQPADEMPKVSDNAALQYWQAFGMLPALDAEQEKLLEDWDTVPLDDAAVKLLEQSRTSVMYLRRGAKLQRCDWGLDYNDGVSLHLPHLAKARTLARIAALDARQAFNQRRSNDAREDVMSLMALARHVGADPILVSTIVRYGIESLAIDAVTPHLPKMNADHAEAAAMFASLPQATTVRQSVFAEKKFFAEWIIRKLKDAEQTRKGSWRELWVALAAPEMPDSLKGVDTYEQATKMMEDFLPVYDELATLVDLPKGEFDSKYPPFAERARSISPVADLLLPAMDKTLGVTRRGDARAAMLLAAIAVVEGGPEKLAGIKDPYGDGPFAYRALGEGFELTSKLVVDGKPVTLTVGDKTKK
jgi:hypothetical protein